MRLAVPAALLLVSLLALPARAALDAKAEGRAAVALFYAGELDSLYARFAPSMASAMSLEQLRDFRAGIEMQLGPEAQVYREDVAPADSVQVYLRRARFERGQGIVDVAVGFDAAARITGLLLRPAAVAFPSDYLDYVPKTRLHLPVAGEWFVAWGGRTLEENYHASTRDQRFALDLLVMDGDATHVDDGAHNSDYFAYGRPVLAPAAGTVVAAVDSVPENAPGQMDGASPLGNHVVIDHGNGEFSFLAHLQPRSLRVAPGDRVEPGDTLGLCGNSGHSSEPHLHYHLQNSPRFGDGDGLPAPFLAYSADGRPVDRGEPVRGQLIAARD
ncbi:MAG: peptidoglycan DD-metalloendopeptidase family protein [Candidatus Latescibacteria bacterium]|nr:peptidoglycan DD-metalloendopeptidase family protein [Candidatus Latescibacterota bacterium]